MVFSIPTEDLAVHLEWERLLEAAVEEGRRERGAAEAGSRLLSPVTFLPVDTFSMRITAM